MKFDYLIVGSGLFGSVFAHRAKRAGKRCLVIDKRSHKGGNIYCDNIEGIMCINMVRIFSIRRIRRFGTL